MSEETKIPAESAETSAPAAVEESPVPAAEKKTAAPAKSFSQVFFVPNLINLISALLILVVMILALLVPMMKVGTPADAYLSGYNGENEIQVSALDIMLDLGKEIDMIEDKVPAYVTPENGGNFSKAITLLAYQATADYEEAIREYEEAFANGYTEEKPDRPAVENRSAFMFSCFSFLLLPLCVLILAIVFVAALIKAVVRFFKCKPYPKLGDSSGAAVAVPIFIAAFVYGMPWVAGLVGSDMGYLKYIGIANGLITIAVVAVAALILDVVCKNIATGISKKHYPYQK